MTFALKIGSQTITVDDLPDLLDRYQLMPKLVRELVIDDAIASVDCSDDDLNAAFQDFCRRNQIGDEAALQAWLSQNQLDIDTVRDRISRNLRIERYKQQTWGPKLQGIFLENKTQYDKAIYSLIRTSDAYISQELFFRIQEDPQLFADMAKEYSQGPEAKTGGMVGPVPMGNLHPTLVQMIASSEPGQLHSPVRLDKWYVIVRVEQHLPAKLDDTMRQTLLKQLYDSWLQEQVGAVSAAANPAPPSPPSSSVSIPLPGTPAAAAAAAPPSLPANGTTSSNTSTGT